MHICFIIHEYPKQGFPHGGVGTFTKTLGKELVKAGHHVSVVGIGYLDFDERENDEGVWVYRLAQRKFTGLTWLCNSRKINQQIEKIHKRRPIDIVETTELGLAFIKKLNGIKYMIRQNGGHHFFAESENRGINWWKGFQEKRSFRKADKIIGVSRYVMDHTANYIDYQLKRGPIIFNPANFENFYPADPKKMIPGRILFAGTICEKKGIRQLIQAMPMIRNKIPEAQLYVAGRDWKFPDGSSYTNYLQKMINQPEASAIHFLGPIPNEQIPSLIEEAEVCVYPSHMEAMPLAWIEVLSMGKAFVASQSGPGPEVVRHNETGLLCDPLNPEDIAQKVIFLMQNKEKAIEFGKSARRDVLERFDPKMLTRKNIEFYQSLIQ